MSNREIALAFCVICAAFAIGLIVDTIARIAAARIGDDE